MEEQIDAFGIVAEAMYDLVPRRWLTDTEIMLVGRAESVAGAAYQIAHGAPAGNVARREAGDFGIALFVVFVELDACAIFERNEETIDGGGPGIAERGQVEL